ncbi:hypothetical protein BDZ91DRAFT_737601 [Kalaharituber pfeilii]|nr:hypothetical protein BDZ91DRAFT_737601 [Kalaharituber pfeilii]
MVNNRLFKCSLTARIAAATPLHFRFGKVSVIMNLLTHLAIFVSLVLPISAQKAINKPAAISDAVQERLVQRFADIAIASRSRYSKLEAGHYPENCVQDSQHGFYTDDDSGVHCPLENVEAYTVKFSDAPGLSWYFCRCTTGISIDTMVDMFGKLPSRMKAVVRTLMAWPPLLSGVLAYTSGPDIAITSALQTSTGKQDMNALVHEACHILDGLYDISLSQNFQLAIAEVTCVVTNYGNRSHVEEMAEVGVFLWVKHHDPLLYEKVYTHNKMSCADNQLNFMDAILGESRLSSCELVTNQAFEQSPLQHYPDGKYTGPKTQIEGNAKTRTQRKNTVRVYAPNGIKDIKKQRALLVYHHDFYSSKAMLSTQCLADSRGDFSSDIGA